MHRAVFLDRDGVLNEPLIRDGLPYPPQTLDEFRLYPEAAPACALLRQAGFLLVLATNQPDVGRGTLQLETVQQMHALLLDKIPLDRIEMCTAADSNAPGSERRKPAPGMLLDAAKALQIDLSRSYMVGDRWRDIDCGHAAGCITILINHPYAEKLRQSPHHYADSILAAARLILALEQRDPVPFAASSAYP
jgi:D-glycero-D-manno-heptose 1,7-bisphosphate phosphatase